MEEEQCGPDTAFHVPEMGDIADEVEPRLEDSLQESPRLQHCNTTHSHPPWVEHAQEALRRTDVAVEVVVALHMARRKGHR